MQSKTIKRASYIVGILFVAGVLVLGAVTTARAGSMYASFWSLVPPVVAIVLALITKEVYLSLFIGIASAALFYAEFNPLTATTATIEMFTSRIGDEWNVGILMFLVMLGIIVSLMNKAGGSAAYGRWASKRIHSKRAGLLSTFGLGILIFVDDYFNCLTVGSVMLPVTDKQKISRAKLAYIIDATAAPICIIAPISSWAAAVTSSAEGSNIDGFAVFLQSIPYNLYALLTIIMVVAISVMKFDFGPMKRHEQLAEQGDLFGGMGNDYVNADELKPNFKGKVLDLVLPVIILIVCCISGMLYTGGILEGENLIDAFANSDAAVGLALGSLVALILTFLLYVPRKVVSFREFADSLPEGFRQMVPAILILCFAWTLSGFCNEALGAGEFVHNAVYDNAAASGFMPAILFLVSLGLAFSIGTSWGTFGILIPIVLSIFPLGGEMMIISIAASLAGSVCGDHISPISDTTIMASTGAQCNHIAHVSTQIPYALLVAAVSLVGYIITAFLQNALLVLGICIVLLLASLFIIKRVTTKKA